MLSKLVLTSLCIFLLATSGLAQEYNNELGLKSDNDAYLWTMQDRYYTNGLFLYYRKASQWQKLEKVIYEVSIGQQMYTPYSGSRPNPAQHDRPFAAYLYGGASASFFSKKESLLKIGLTLGTIGPNALGKQSQELLHKIMRFYSVEGWEYQIKNELTANLQAQYAQLLHRTPRNKVDFTLDTYLHTGTIFNKAGLGILFRVGNFHQLFNSASYQANIGNKNYTKKKNEFFFYAKPQVHYVAYDATVQGSLFKQNSPVTFNTKPIVFSQTLGLNYSSPKFTVDYSLIFLSKEIESRAKAHQYGSIALSYRF